MVSTKAASVHLAGCLAALVWGSASYAADSANIRIGNFAFAPEIITVTVGTKVQWVNEDDAPHTVIGVDKGTAIKSPALDTDDKYAVVLDKPGTYKYFCSIHPHMVGVVVVK